MPADGHADEFLEGQLEGIERALEEERAREAELTREGEAIRHELDSLRIELVAAAAAAQTRERAISDLEASLEALGAEETAKAEALAAREDEMVRTLGALQMLSRRPVEALIALPVSLTDAMRTSALLGAAIPALESEARLLQAELATLTALRAEIAREHAALASEIVELDRERETVAGLIARKGAFHAETEDARRAAESEAAALAEEAVDLRELLRKLEARSLAAAAEVVEHVRKASERDVAAPGESVTLATESERVAALEITPPTEMDSISDARGSLVFPVSGRVVIGYNETSSAGIASRGITVESRPDALVTAPFDGVIVFAGPFRGYGLLLIIEHSEGYHSLLAGMGRIDGVVGQWVLAGEPVGIMGPEQDVAPQLYVELRRNGQPVNPLPWLTAADRKASG